MDLINKMAGFICNPGKRGLDKPLWEDGRVLVTDGAIAITFFDQKERSEDWNNFPDTLSFALEFCDKTGDSVDIEFPPIEPEEWWKFPFKQVECECEECEGSGGVTCNYGHDHECEECDGRGLVMSTLLEKNWPPAEKRYINLPSIGFFNKRYLWIVRQLASDRKLQYSVDNSASEPALRFSFEDGNGVLMGAQKI